MEGVQCIKAFRHGESDLLKFKLSIRLSSKGDLYDLEHRMIVGATQAGLSILGNAALLGILCTIISES